MRGTIANLVTDVKPDDLATADLDQLIRAVQTAHAGVTASFARGIDHALTAGRALIIAKNIVPRGCR